MERKPVIYQLLPRLFANRCANPVANGTISQNGSGKLNDITTEVIEAIRDLGATHIWYTGVIEHAHSADYSEFGITPDNPHVVKGKAGSPYAIKDYYDIDPDLATNVPQRMAEFEALVDRTHKAGMSVVIDFVPNHTARRYKSDNRPKGAPEDFGVNDHNDMFFFADNNYYYLPRQQFVPEADMGQGSDAYVEFPAKASGNDCFNAFPGQNDWYDTVKLNYGVDYGDQTRHFEPIPDTWHKMLHILKFWASKSVDAFRCDMVHMVPLEFWEWAIAGVKKEYPNVKFIAEIYEPSLYRPFIFQGGFDYLYDKVSLYDTLRAIQTGNTSAAAITFCWQTVEGISGHMLNFLENHDEQRYASRFYCGTASKVLPALVVSSMINTGPMMVYMGQELGEPGADAEGFSGHDGRTTIFDYWSIDTLRRWLGADGVPSDRFLNADERSLREMYANVLSIASTEPSIVRGKFFDLMYVNFENPTTDPHRHYFFVRVDKESRTAVVVAVNFGEHEANMRINLPEHMFEVFGIEPTDSIDGCELLTGRRMKTTFTPEIQFPAFVGPYSAAVWRVEGLTFSGDSDNSEEKQ